MVIVKQAADFITLARAILAFWLAWLGLNQAADSLPLVVWLMIANWTGDSLDGPLARRSRVSYQTWIGAHDLEVDVLVSLGLLAYLVAAGFLSWAAAGLYLLLWLVIFWRLGGFRSLEMLVQAPIYGWFIWVALRHAPQAGRWIIAWIVAAIIVTWPHFPRDIVPGFLAGMRQVGHRRPGGG
ncbi:MAG: hypothetical protein AB1791_11480 [Chloroflexota bacterium]